MSRSGHSLLKTFVATRFLGAGRLLFVTKQYATVVTDGVPNCLFLLIKIISIVVISHFVSRGFLHTSLATRYHLVLLLRCCASIVLIVTKNQP